MARRKLSKPYNVYQKTIELNLTDVNKLVGRTINGFYVNRITLFVNIEGHITCSVVNKQSKMIALNDLMKMNININNK